MAGTYANREYLLPVAACVAIVLGAAGAAHARMAAPSSLRAMVRGAELVFRGHCMSAEVRTVDIAGARIPVTTYTFAVGEHLKGARRSTVAFRQVGTPDGRARDIGRLVGLPVYALGTEYVLLLLPQGRAGVTSPAGAGDGAFVVEGERVRRLHPRVRAPTATSERPRRRVHTMSYEALRRTVLEEANR